MKPVSICRQKNCDVTGRRLPYPNNLHRCHAAPVPTFCNSNAQGVTHGATLDTEAQSRARSQARHGSGNPADRGAGLRGPVSAAAAHRRAPATASVAVQHLAESEKGPHQAYRGPLRDHDALEFTTAANSTKAPRLCLVVSFLFCLYQHLRESRGGGLVGIFCLGERAHGIRDAEAHGEKREEPECKFCKRIHRLRLHVANYIALWLRLVRPWDSDEIIVRWIRLITLEIIDKIKYVVVCWSRPRLVQCNKKFVTRVRRCKRGSQSRTSDFAGN